MAEIKGGQQLENVLAAIAKKLKGGHVRVGFLETSTYPDGTPVALVAAVQNFGAPAMGIPPRPFFTNMIKTNAPNWPRLVDAALQASGNDTEKALEIVGARIAGQLIQEINATNDPPLAPETVRRKGFDKPLVDSGIMRQSLQGSNGYEVVMDGITP